MRTSLVRIQEQPIRTNVQSLPDRKLLPYIIKYVNIPIQRLCTPNQQMLWLGTNCAATNSRCFAWAIPTTLNTSVRQHRSIIALLKEDLCTVHQSSAWAPKAAMQWLKQLIKVFQREKIEMSPSTKRGQIKLGDIVKCKNVGGGGKQSGRIFIWKNAVHYCCQARFLAGKIGPLKRLIPCFQVNLKQSCTAYA